MESKEKEKEISGTSILYVLLTIIGFCIAIYKLYYRISDYFEEKEDRKQDKIEKVERYQKWSDEMTYNLEHLSIYHYITAEYLVEDSNSIFHNYLKVIDINGTDVQLVKFRAPGYTPVPRLIEESYMTDDKEDTITLSIEKLKNTIFENSEIPENMYRYQDSLKREGLFYIIKDINYINGPSLSRSNELASRGIGDTVTFKFRNENEKAILTKIINVSGDFKWQDSLPMPINGFNLNASDYNRSAEFELNATNVDFTKDYKFKLQFEDSLKNKHIFLVIKESENSPDFYESKRVLD
jgi:hypothetical protein